MGELVKQTCTAIQAELWSKRIGQVIQSPPQAEPGVLRDVEQLAVPVGTQTHQLVIELADMRQGRWYLDGHDHGPVNEAATPLPPMATFLRDRLAAACDRFEADVRASRVEQSVAVARLWGCLWNTSVECGLLDPDISIQGFTGNLPDRSHRFDYVVGGFFDERVVTFRRPVREA